MRKIKMAGLSRLVGKMVKKNTPKPKPNPSSKPKKQVTQTFASEMRELNKKAMTDAARQREAIKIAKKYGKPIKIGGKSFGPPKSKSKPYNELSAEERRKMKFDANLAQVELNASRGLMNKGGMAKKKKKK